jgi:hypothetical protein
MALVHLSWGTVVKGMPDAGTRMSEETAVRLRAAIAEHVAKGGGQLFCSPMDRYAPLTGELTALSEVVEIHNPTADPLSVRVRASRSFSAWCGFDETVQVPAGASVRRLIALTGP